MPLSTARKRKFRIAAAALFVVACALALWAFWLEPASLGVRRVSSEEFRRGARSTAG